MTTVLSPVTVGRFWLRFSFTDMGSCCMCPFASGLFCAPVRLQGPGGGYVYRGGFSAVVYIIFRRMIRYGLVIQATAGARWVFPVWGCLAECCRVGISALKQTCWVLCIRSSASDIAG